MITNVSEGVVRVASKIDPSAAIHERAVNQQKTDEMKEARPVEVSDESNKAETEKKRKDEGGSRFLVGEKQVVFEKYDKNGDVILRIPPSEKPVDQIA